VLEVNEKLKRISLSMKLPDSQNSERKAINKPQNAPTLNDLKAKFNRK